MTATVTAGTGATTEAWRGFAGAHWRDQVDGPPRYDLSIVTSDEESTGSVEDVSDDDADRLLMDAVAVIQEYDRASASLLQRRLKIGYGRAARIIDQLHLAGVLGPPDGSKPRDVLIGLEDLDRVAGERTAA